MRTRHALLEHLWRSVIDGHSSDASLREQIAYAKSHPGAPFTAAASAIERLVAQGVSPSDICTIQRDASYRAVFATLYSLDDPGVEGNDVLMLHESLLEADPSGKEGR